MDISKLKRGKLLGRGIFGTVYLTEFDKTKYALKVQHILPGARKKNYKYEIVFLYWGLSRHH